MKAKLTGALLLLAACTDPAQLVRPTVPGASKAISAATGTTYMIMFNQPSGLPKDAAALVRGAGGSIVSDLSEVGILGVRSSDPDFAANVGADPSVKYVVENRDFQMIPRGEGVDLMAFADVTAAEPGEAGPAEPAGPDPQPGTDPLYFQQWDKMRMNASATGSYAVQQGRRDVVVGIIDTGIEILPVAHPDIAPNLDIARSRSFLSPIPGGDPSPAAWDDKHGHGSWCASAVAAPINGIGISGVAPRVTVVALKAIGDNGVGNFLAVLNALLYAANNHFDVVSMSIGAYVPKSEAGAFVALVQRVVNYARENGVTPLAALSNENRDISDGATMRDSVVVPAEVAGVIGVSATTYTNRKAFYSNYGSGKTDVSAPGGGSTTFDPMPPIYFGNGRVLGAWSAEGSGNVDQPAYYLPRCSPGPGGACYYYAWVRGTSMATPNAAGVAALIVSQYGDFSGTNGRKPHMSPTRVEAILQQTANNQACIDNAAPQYPAVLQANCKGEAGGYTNFFGKGIVDALKAVTQ